MKWKRYWLGILTFTFCLSLTVFPTRMHSAKAFSSQVIQQGATGSDVVELQARLQYLGLYKGQIDGKFGWSTYWALRNFQKKFGLPVDGLAGTSTKQMLVNHSNYDQAWVTGNLRKGVPFTYYGGTPLKDQVGTTNGNGTNGNTGNNGSNGNNTSGNASNSSTNNTPTPTTPTPTSTPNGYSANDIKLLANAVYGESRGEPFIGQVAVAAVILNRVASSKFPDTVAGVIFQPGAFTAVQDGQIWLTPNDTAKKAVMDAINGWDPSHGALYYFNPDTATSSWIWGRPQIEKIGKHIFTK